MENENVTPVGAEFLEGSDKPETIKPYTFEQHVQDGKMVRRQVTVQRLEATNND